MISQTLTVEIVDRNMLVVYIATADKLFFY